MLELWIIWQLALFEKYETFLFSNILSILQRLMFFFFLFHFSKFYWSLNLNLKFKIRKFIFLRVQTINYSNSKSTFYDNNKHICFFLNNYCFKQNEFQRIILLLALTYLFHERYDLVSINEKEGMMGIEAGIDIWQTF